MTAWKRALGFILSIVAWMIWWTGIEAAKILWDNDQLTPFVWDVDAGHVTIFISTLIVMAGTAASEHLMRKQK